jgi:hypothetical protein
MGSGWRGAVRDGLVAAMTFRGQESEQQRACVITTVQY